MSPLSAAACNSPVTAEHCSENERGGLKHVCSHSCMIIRVAPLTPGRPSCALQHSPADGAHTHSNDFLDGRRNSISKNVRRHWTCAVLVEWQRPLPAQLHACEHQGSTVCPTSCSGAGPQINRVQPGYRSFTGRRQPCVCVARTAARGNLSNTRRWPLPKVKSMSGAVPAPQ